MCDKFLFLFQAVIKHVDFKVVRCAVIASPGFTKVFFVSVVLSCKVTLLGMSYIYAMLQVKERACLSLSLLCICYLIVVYIFNLFLRFKCAGSVSSSPVVGSRKETAKTHNRK